MSTAAAPAPIAAPATPTIPAAEPPLWPIPVAMYLEMVRRGVLGEDDRVYLWNGRLAPLMPPNRPHSYGVKRGYDAIRPLLPEGYDIDREQPLALRREPSVPQPDLVVIRGRFDNFLADFPTTADVALIIEVADSSLALDRKLAFTYAAEDVPVYWLVNLPGRRIEVFTEPAEGAYTRCTPFGPEDEVPIVLDGREVGRLRVAELLPPGE